MHQTGTFEGHSSAILTELQRHGHYYLVHSYIHFNTLSFHITIITNSALLELSKITQLYTIGSDGHIGQSAVVSGLISPEIFLHGVATLKTVLSKLLQKVM